MSTKTGLLTRRVKMPRPLVTSDPKVMTGKPVIAGTRITVEMIGVIEETSLSILEAFLPLSDDWRNRQDRLFDWTTRILVLLRKCCS